MWREAKLKRKNQKNQIKSMHTKDKKKKNVHTEKTERKKEQNKRRIEPKFGFPVHLSVFCFCIRINIISHLTFFVHSDLDIFSFLFKASSSLRSHFVQFSFSFLFFILNILLFCFICYFEYFHLLRYSI